MSDIADEEKQRYVAKIEAMKLNMEELMQNLEDSEIKVEAMKINLQVAEEQATELKEKLVLSQQL